MTKYFNYLRYSLLPYVKEDIEDATRRYFPTNWIKGVLEIAPSLDTVNAWIRTPSATTDFSNIPVSPMIIEAIRFNPTVGYLRRLKGECEYQPFLISNNLGVIKIIFNPLNHSTPSNSISLASILNIIFTYSTKYSLEIFRQKFYMYTQKYFQKIK